MSHTHAPPPLAILHEQVCVGNGLPHSLGILPMPQAAACTQASALGPKPTGVCRQHSTVTLTGRWFKYRAAYARQG